MNFTGSFIPDELALAFSHARAFNLHVLSDTVVELGSVRFVGADVVDRLQNLR